MTNQEQQSININVQDDSNLFSTIDNIASNLSGWELAAVVIIVTAIVALAYVYGKRYMSRSKE